MFTILFLVLIVYSAIRSSHAGVVYKLKEISHNYAVLSIDLNSEDYASDFNVLVKKYQVTNDLKTFHTSASDQMSLLPDPNLELIVPNLQSGTWYGLELTLSGKDTNGLSKAESSSYKALLRTLNAQNSTSTIPPYTIEIIDVYFDSGQLIVRMNFSINNNETETNVYVRPQLKECSGVTAGAIQGQKVTQQEIEVFKFDVSPTGENGKIDLISPPKCQLICIGITAPKVEPWGPYYHILPLHGMCMDLQNKTSKNLVRVDGQEIEITGLYLSSTIQVTLLHPEIIKQSRVDIEFKGCLNITIEKSQPKMINASVVKHVLTFGQFMQVDNLIDDQGNEINDTESLVRRCQQICVNVWLQLHNGSLTAETHCVLVPDAPVPTSGPQREGKSGLSFLVLLIVLPLTLLLMNLMMKTW